MYITTSADNDALYLEQFNKQTERTGKKEIRKKLKEGTREGSFQELINSININNLREPQFYKILKYENKAVIYNVRIEWVITNTTEYINNISFP